MSRPAWLMAGALGLSLTACGERESQPPAADSPASAPVQAESPAPVASPAPSEAADTPAVALDGEGLRFIDPTNGSTRLVAFGVPADQIITALERVQGRPPERSSNAECGAGPLQFAAWADGLSVVLQEDRFAGWSVRDDAPAGEVTTISGIGVGSTRAEVEAVQTIEMVESTLGAEFTSGGLSGIFSSARPDARVTTLWAGVSCLFR